MTPKPSEAELRELDAIVEKVLRGNPTAVDMVTLHLATPGLLARIRELEVMVETLNLFTVTARAEAAEKRAAELEEERDELREMVVAMDRGDKRAVTAELSAALRQLSRIEAKRPLPPDVLANALQGRIHPASGRLLSASPVVAKPDAAVREALAAARVAAQAASRQLRNGLPRGGRARISIALRAIVAMADEALAGA